MRIPRAQLAQLVASAPRLGRAPRRHYIGRLTNKLRSDIRVAIAKHMQPWMLLLDETVQFFIHFERYQYSRRLTGESSPFALQVSRLRSCALAIRELVALGQEAPAHVLARAFVEDVELAMALAADPAFAIQYSNATDESAFWKKYIGYGKINARVEQFLRRAGGTAEQIDEHIGLHKQVKNSLSGHVHTASYSSFRAAIVPSLSHPGMFHFRELGALSAHLPRLCLFLANETHVFSACCINLFIRPDAPAALMSYKPTGLLGDAVASAHVLQKLLANYGGELERLCEGFLPLELPERSREADAT